jgi:hypothetical protein
VVGAKVKTFVYKVFVEAETQEEADTILFAQANNKWNTTLDNVVEE